MKKALLFLVCILNVFLFVLKSELLKLEVDKSEKLTKDGKETAGSSVCCLNGHLDIDVFCSYSSKFS